MLGDDRPRSASRQLCTCARATSSCSRSWRCTAGRLNAESLCAELYGDDGHPASIRVEMSRLRRLLPGAMDPDALRAHLPRRTATSGVSRALLEHDAVGEAAEVYPGPPGHGSDAPGHHATRATSSRPAAPGRHHLR